MSPAPCGAPSHGCRAPSPPSIVTRAETRRGLPPRRLSRVARFKRAKNGRRLLCARRPRERAAAASQAQRCVARAPGRAPHEGSVACVQIFARRGADRGAERWSTWPLRFVALFPEGVLRVYADAEDLRALRNPVSSIDLNGSACLFARPPKVMQSSLSCGAAPAHSRSRRSRHFRSTRVSNYARRARHSFSARPTNPSSCSGRARCRRLRHAAQLLTSRSRRSAAAARCSKSCKSCRHGTRTRRASSCTGRHSRTRNRARRRSRRGLRQPSERTLTLTYRRLSHGNSPADATRKRAAVASSATAARGCRRALSLSLSPFLSLLCSARSASS